MVVNGEQAVGCCDLLPTDRAVKPAGLLVKVDWIANSIERKDRPTSVAITANDLCIVPELNPVTLAAHCG